MIEQKLRFKQNHTNINSLKLVHFNNEKKTGQFYSEPTSQEPTPKNMLRLKLDPLDKTSITQKLNDVVSGYQQSSGQRTKNSENQKTVLVPKKNFLMSVLEDTPKSQLKRPKKSKFASHLAESIEKGYKFEDSSTDTSPIEIKLEKSGQTFSEAFGDWQEVKKDNENEAKAPKGYKISSIQTPTGRSSIGFKSLSTALIKPAPIFSDIEVSSKMEKRFNESAFDLPYRHLVFSPKVDIEKFKKHIAMAYKGLLYATNSLRSPSEKFIKSKQVSIQDPIISRHYESSLFIGKHKTLILDLDETLIHACTLKDSPDVILSYQSVAGEASKQQLPIVLRPYLKEFFNKVGPLYEIIIFTASAPNYAKAIVNYLDSENKFINTVLTRENCMETKNGFFIKDLRIIKNREMKDLIIIDNLVHSFGFQLENGVPILEFIDDKQDMELKFLSDYLIDCSQVDDIREFNKQHLKLRNILNFKLEDLLSQLFIILTFHQDFYVH